MTRSGPALALALLLVAAGCLGPAVQPGTSDGAGSPTGAAGSPGSTEDPPSTDGPEGPSKATPTPTPSSSPAGTPTDSAPGTASPTPTAAGDDNPFGSATVVVGIDGSAAGEAHRALVADALAWWNGRAADYSTHEEAPRFVLDADAADPDLVVEFRDSVTCDRHREAVGCAPLLTPDRTVDGTVTVSVQTAWETTERPTDGPATRYEALLYDTLLHEFGHVLGVRHNEPPVAVMAAGYEATGRHPDATDRPVSTPSATVAVYVDDSAVDGTEAERMRRQVGRALEYYEDGAEGYAPANVSFVVVDDPWLADVRVDLAPSSREDGASQWGAWGADFDADEAPELYTFSRVYVSGIDAEAVGWHVGYWLGFAVLGAADAEELPPPFRDATAEERRSEWWE